MFDSVIAGKVGLCVTTEILLEYREIMEQRNGVEVAENVINFITVMPTTERIEIYYAFNLITDDPDDNKFVDCAVAADAHYLVSNDSHFSALPHIDFPKISWLTLDEFTSEYKAQLTA
ncbi:hypothetical protein GCM10027577_45330 [Spirosoma fluminis]